ncbi:hypothetical protein [Oscillatoria sp. FACHB-1406]|uniref:hypothetical protein n=1 Tax=Oscillatoria sp. FACHB-1406 TaxID=2692846 RepID=UPI001686DD3E|nr:hypothetical protein [Oscillatoria sp. FACHB-1406]MBD2579589.1 hypothetical protein [Oscillatoria sp. FACHB-1406]
MEIIQLVPHPMDSATGISDYALRLAERLLQAHQIRSHFVVYEKQFYGRKSTYKSEDFTETALADSTPEAIFSLFSKRSIGGIIFHYNFRGEHEPSRTAYWLVSALKLVRQQYSFKLIVMFHELPLTFNVRRFTLPHPHHILAARSLVKMADAIFTNSTKFQKTLSKWTSKPIPRLLNISTLGEPEEVPTLTAREPRLVVLGTIYSRPQIYQEFTNELLMSCQMLGIKEIYDVGAPFELNFPNAEGIRVVQLGVQSREAISELLLTSLAGFLDYSAYPGELSKSSIFAAHCTHGVIPILSKYNPAEADGINMNQHYVVAGESLKNMNLEALQTVSNNAQKWYRSHSIAENTKIFATRLLS